MRPPGKKKRVELLASVFLQGPRGGSVGMEILAEGHTPLNKRPWGQMSLQPHPHGASGRMEVVGDCPDIGQLQGCVEWVSLETKVVCLLTFPKLNRVQSEEYIVPFLISFLIILHFLSLYFHSFSNPLTLSFTVCKHGVSVLINFIQSCQSGGQFDLLNRLLTLDTDFSNSWLAPATYLDCPVSGREGSWPGTNPNHRFPPSWWWLTHRLP